MSLAHVAESNRPRANHRTEKRLNVLIASFMILFHVGAVAALFFFTWSALFVAIFLYWVAGSLGIGMGYHRLLTHRGYRTPKWVEYFLTVCAVMALEGGPLVWVATHRIHHQFPDKEGDPHSPRDGKWWAHVGWILVGNALRHDASTLERYVPDLAEDKFQVWITEYHFVPTVVLGIASLRSWRMAFSAVGDFLSHGRRPACYMACKLCYSHLGFPPFCDV